MNNNSAKINSFKNIKDHIKNLDKKKRNIYIILLCGCILVAVVTVLLLNHKEYVLLYQKLDAKECYEIVTKLDEMGMGYKVENGTDIYVEKKDEPKLKMQLAAEGHPKSALNNNIFTDNIDFMSTDFEKVQYKLFQLQEWLQASIKTLDNVNDAIVTLAIPDNSLVVLKEDRVPPTASVLLVLEKDVTLSKKQVKGIEQLVSKAVPGLTEKNVSIVDQTGAVINGQTEDTELASATGKIQAENDVSEIISSRISSLLEPIYGKGNISVAVNVILDYNKKITEKTEYTPASGNAGVINHYESEYEGSGGAGAAGGVPGMDSNAEIPGYETPAAGGTDNTAKNRVSVDYVVSQIIEKIQKDGAEIKDTTVAVLINKAEMSQEEADKITGIVANTAGIDKGKVELFPIEFAASNVKTNNPGIIPKPPVPVDYLSLPYLIFYGAAALVLIILIIIIMIIAGRKRKKALANKIKVDKTKAEQTEQEERESILEITSANETKEQQLTRELKEFSISAPQITASLLRTLLKGDFD